MRARRAPRRKPDARLSSRPTVPALGPVRVRGRRVSGGVPRSWLPVRGAECPSDQPLSPGGDPGVTFVQGSDEAGRRRQPGSSTERMASRHPGIRDRPRRRLRRCRPVPEGLAPILDGHGKRSASTLTERSEQMTPDQGGGQDGQNSTWPSAQAVPPGFGQECSPRECAHCCSPRPGSMRSMIYKCTMNRRSCVAITTLDPILAQSRAWEAMSRADRSSCAVGSSTRRRVGRMRAREHTPAPPPDRSRKGRLPDARD